MPKSTVIKLFEVVYKINMAQMPAASLAFWSKKKIKSLLFALLLSLLKCEHTNAMAYTMHRGPERCIGKVNNENKNMFVTCAPVSF